MRFQRALQLVDDTADLTAALSTVTDPSTLPIATPWSSSELNRIVFEDIFGATIPSNTRASAMRIPAVARARNLLVSTIARLNLQELVRDTPADPQPYWLYGTNRSTSPQHRLAWTVDDLIFYGWSCWRRENGADRFPVAADRVNYGDWSVTPDNHVAINGAEVDDRDVILIPGLHEGILTYGKDTLDDTRTLYRNVRQRLQNPIPQLDLHQTGGEQLTDTEIDDLIARWAAARAGDNGGVGYTNESIQLNPVGEGDQQLMIEARNAASLDIARLLGVHAGLIDATTPKASLNYETATGRNQEFVDFDLQLYLLPIAARLSLDDVVPRGRRVAFDLSDFIAASPSVSGPALED